MLTDAMSPYVHRVVVTVESIYNTKVNNDTERRGRDKQSKRQNEFCVFVRAIFFTVRI